MFLVCYIVVQLIINVTMLCTLSMTLHVALLDHNVPALQVYTCLMS